MSVPAAYAVFQALWIIGIVCEQMMVIVAFEECNVEICQTFAQGRETMAEICEDTYPEPAVVYNEGAGIYRVVGGGNGLNCDVADFDAIAGGEVLKLGGADFADAVFHDLMGIAGTKDGYFEFAMVHAGAGSVIGMVVGYKQTVELAAVYSVGGHAFAGTTERYAGIE